jgi:excisionase family DNA binding protein
MNTQEELDLWPEPAPALVTIKQAARILNLGRSTIYQLIDAGEIHTVHFGRSHRIPLHSLTELIARHRAAESARAES